MQFLKHYSFSVSMSLSYGGIYDDYFVENFVLSRAVKEL